MLIAVLVVVVLDAGVALGALVLVGLGPLPVIGALAAFAAAQLVIGPRCALAAVRARRASADEEPELHAALERLSQLADMRKPALAITEIQAPVAFAVGRSERSATICLSRALVEGLEPRERAAILAHELAHVAHRDVAVMTGASAIPMLAGLLLRVGWWPGYSERWFDIDIPRLPPAWALVLKPALPLAAVTGFAMVMVRIVLFVPLAGLALIYALTLPALAALSRAREFAADRGAAILTGAPAVVASALLKVSGEIERLPERDLRAALLMNGLFVVPLGPAGRLLGRLTATHPPLRARIERLVAMQATLEERPLTTV
jgi:heat shock protein HtpX